MVLREGASSNPTAVVNTGWRPALQNLPLPIQHLRPPTQPIRQHKPVSHKTPCRHHRDLKRMEQRRQAQGGGNKVHGGGDQVQGAGGQVHGAGDQIHGAGDQVQGAGGQVQGAGDHVQGASQLSRTPSSRNQKKGSRC